MSEPARLVVRLTPRAGRDAIDGWGEDAAGQPVLKARVTAPPVDGKANAALVRLIAKTLELAPSAVRLTAGEGARIKTLSIAGLDQIEVRRLLGGPRLP